METPLLSVAIITYNQENFIAQTLESIIQQKHDYPYEIVIGDDCSKDNTRNIIEKYKKQYPKIVKTIFNIKNKGIISNYFNVLDHCSGKYIMECAGDDFWLPGKIARQIEFMETNPEIGMCYGTAKVWNELKKKYDKKKFGSNKESIYDLLQGNDIPAPTVCFRRDIFLQYVDYVKPISQNWLMEDYPEWLWFAGNSKIKFINESFAVYRELVESACHIVDTEKALKFNKSIENVRIYYANFYNISIQKRTDEEILFELLFKNTMNNYSQENRNSVISLFPLLHSPTFKTKVKFFICKFPLLFVIFHFIQK